MVETEEVTEVSQSQRFINASSGISARIVSRAFSTSEEQERGKFSLGHENERN